MMVKDKIDKFKEDPYLKKQKVYNDFLEYILPLIKGKVLDIGCGDGRYLKYFSRDSIGIEINPKRREIAINMGLNVVWQDVNEGLKFKDNSFDTVFCSHILEHVDSPVFLLKEIKRVLKPNGVLIIGLPTKGSLLERLWFRTHYYRDHDHLYSFDIDDIVGLLKKMGFQVSNIYIGYHFFSLFGKIFNMSNFIKKISQKIETHYWVVAKPKG